jgi:hypothetical protein
MTLLDQLHELFEGKYAMLAVVGLVVASAFALSKLGIAQDPREPPVLEPHIPFIGHVLGVLTRGQEYLGRLG